MTILERNFVKATIIKTCHMMLETIKDEEFSVVLMENIEKLIYACNKLHLTKEAALLEEQNNLLSD